jgi:hypothetical protein
MGGDQALVNYFNYTTMRGDTFDILALDAFNEELNADVIIKANPQYSGVIVFDAGVVLRIPIIEEQSLSTLPPWKR